MLLLDLNSTRSSDVRLVAAACRVRDEKTDGKTLQFRADGVAGTNAIVGISMPRAPAEVLVSGQPLDGSKFDFSGGILRVRFPNSVEPASVEVRLVK